MQQKLTIHLKERSYPIFIGDNVLPELGNLIRMQIPSAERSFIITNATVNSLYGDVIFESLRCVGLEPALGVIPDGEEYKTLKTASELFDQLIEHRLDRSSVVVSLGGGVVGDLAGFVAATYMRGVAFVQVPTTLLAQVDSSIGGKVAVNHQAGKNLIGAFYQPKLVLIDTMTLQTLPMVEFRAGMAEVIKHGMILDAGYWRWIEEHIEDIVDHNQETLSKLVYGSCVIKGKVIEADEREDHLRAILNFGHTVGHALEAVTHYARYRHGEAVSIGMVQASRLAEQFGLINGEEVNVLIQLLRKLQLPTELPADVSAQGILQAMRQDKKSYQGKVKLILPTSIGQVKIVDQWLEEDMQKVLEMGQKKR